MRRIRGRHAAVALGALVAVAIGTTTTIAIAQEGDDGGGTIDAPPGEIYNPTEEEARAEAENTEAIVTGGSVYDDTVLTKFVPGSAFVPWTGVGSIGAGGIPSGDKMNFSLTSGCVSPDEQSEGTLSAGFAAVELPDGAKITGVRLYAVDSDAAGDVELTLFRDNFSVPLLLGGPTRSNETITSLTTSGSGGAITVQSPALNETTGSFNSGAILSPVQHRFYTLFTEMRNAAGTNQAICGVEVLYQVLAATTPAGTVFTPIDPIRAYDSRQAAYAPNNVVLGPNQSRVISIKDARDTAGNIVTADVIPTNATAITYNITIAGPTAPNFVAVTPGDAASFTASAINFNGTADIANAGTVKIAADRTIKVWGGDQAGSMHILIDVTGYYTPVQNPSFPNMGN